MKSKSKVNLIFILLSVYVIVQFLWWAYLLLDLNADYYHLKQELLLAWQVKGDTEPMIELNRKRWMIAGEGLIFLLLLIVGIVLTARYMKRDMKLARLQRNFLLSVTHELKTPIASMRLYMQTLQKRKLDPGKQAEIIERAISGNQRLEKLVEKILLATQLENSRLDLNIEKHKLAPVVDHAIETIVAIDEYKHRFEVNCPQGILVFADGLALETMLLNLIENAVKYSAENSLIKITVLQEGGFVLFEIENEGSISPSDQKQVFLKFFRAGNEDTRTTKGTGVGLFLVDELADLHGGSASVQVIRNTVRFTLKLRGEKE